MTTLRSLALSFLTLTLLTQFSAAVTYTTIDVPGAGETTGVWDINNTGQMVGGYYDSTQFQEHGFIDTNGSFTTLDFPAAILTVSHGINDSGQVVGQYCASDGTCHGFYYDGTTYTTIEPKNVTASSLQKINNSGQMAGSAVDASGVAHAFIYDLSTNTFTTLRPPGGSNAVADGINNVGYVVGYYLVGSALPGFIYGGGHYKQIAFPPISNSTEAQDINDSGVVVGFVTLETQKGTEFHGFLYQTGQFVRFVFPGTSVTEALGINNAGMIVGLYGDSSNLSHGFVRTP